MNATVGSQGDLISVRREDGLGVVTLAPTRSQCSRLTPARLEALGEAVERLASDEHVALIVLFGGAREFCLGADLDLLRAASAAEAERYLRLGQEVMAGLAAASAPTLAAVGGLALGGGFELALACDLRWAHRRAAFALPEADAGLVPAWGAARSLRRELPSALAWELLTGARIGAARAREAGLIGRIFEDRDFDGRVLGQARALAACGRAVLCGLKTAWRAARDGDAKASEIERELCLNRLAALRGGAGA